MHARDTLRKSEILRGYGSFTRTISEGKALSIGPIRCFFLTVPSAHSQRKAGFAVSRSIRTAAVRNRVKRLMREAYRHNKRLLDKNDALNIGCLQMVFLYVGRSNEEARHLQLNYVEETVRRLLSNIRRNGTGET